MDLVSSVNTNTTIKKVFEGNSQSIIELPSPLIDFIVNFNFLVNNTPVYSSLSGTMNLKGRYLFGREQDIMDIDLSVSTNNIRVNGKFTSIIATLTDLNGADTVIMFIDQLENI